MRAVGGVLLALGAFVVFTRRSTAHHWSDFELLLTLAVPAALLFAIAIAGRAGPGGGPADPARAVLLVCAVLLSPIALFQFLAWSGASAHHLLYDAAVLAVTAAIASAGARRAGAPYVMFLAGLALLGAWILVWLKILRPASPDDVRWTILSGGAVLVAAAGALDLASRPGSSEFATAGGLGAVIAGLQGVVVGAVGAVFAPVTTILAGGATRTVTSNGQVVETSSGILHIPGGQTSGWNIYLLVVSLALAWTGARSRARGVAYVGFLGLVAFAVSVGAELTRLEVGREPSSSLLWWPLVLVVLGIVGLAAPALRRGAR